MRAFPRCCRRSPARRASRSRQCGGWDGDCGSTTPPAMAARRTQPLARSMAGGLTSILKKSLGVITKAIPLRCTEYIAMAGASTGPALMDTPGCDPAAVARQGRAGFSMLCFTKARPMAASGCPGQAGDQWRAGSAHGRSMDIYVGGRWRARAPIFEPKLDVASGPPLKSEAPGHGRRDGCRQRGDDVDRTLTPRPRRLSPVVTKPGSRETRIR